MDEPNAPNADLRESRIGPDAPARAGRADPIDAIIGRRVRRLRVARGLSQTELGAAVDVTFQQTQTYEAGTNPIAASTLVRIAAALDVDPGDLLTEAGKAFGTLPGAAALLEAYAELATDAQRRAVPALVRELKDRQRSS